MRFGTLTSCALILLGAMQPPAEAHIVTLEPDAYAAGTDVSNAWAHEGIRMQSWVSSPTFETGPVLSADAGFRPAFTGSRVFGHHSPYTDETVTGWGAINDIHRCLTDPTFPCGEMRPEWYSALYISFERPVDFVEAFGVWSIDWLGMILLGADGQRIGSVYDQNILFTDGVWLYGSTQVQRESRDIYGVILGGVIGGSNVDMIRVNVPEPGAIALLSLGLLGMGLARQRTRISAGHTARS
jgi:hypothetical protein